MNCNDWLLAAEEKLRLAGVESPRFEAELLLAHAVGKRRLDILVSPEREWGEAMLKLADGFVERRCLREPHAYITGEREFFGLMFHTPPGILIPRPETELLVEAVLEKLPLDSNATVADLCCGSGCIGVSLAVHRPLLRVISVDVDPIAVVATQKNAERHGVDKRVTVIQSDIETDCPIHLVQWVVSNPPYIPERDLAGLQPEIREFEPLRALDGGEDGLDFYRIIARSTWLQSAVNIAVEIGEGQFCKIKKLFEDSGLNDVQFRKDLSGIQRVVSAKRVFV